jgi:hypothetical protein
VLAGISLASLLRLLAGTYASLGDALVELVRIVSVNKIVNRKRSYIMIACNEVTKL